MWLVLFLRHCTGAALHRRHRFGALWEDWSTNTAAASSIPGLSGCVNREGFVPLSTSVVWVGTDSATGGRLSKCFTAAVTTIYGRPEKKTHCSGQAKRTSAEFYFPTAKACPDCFCSKKHSQVLCVWWMADGPEISRLLSLRLICCHHEVLGHLE